MFTSLKMDKIALLASLSPLKPQDRIKALRSHGCANPIITLGKAVEARDALIAS